MSREAHLRTLLGCYDRIAICGGPGTGKTTLAKIVEDRPVIHTDDMRGMPWDAVPDAILRSCEGLDRFVIEGVQVARALRRGLLVEVVLYLDDVHGDQDPKRAAMAKAVSTVFHDWRGWNMQIPVVSPDILTE